jgi:hypothetical protein
MHWQDGATACVGAGLALFCRACARSTMCDCSKQRLAHFAGVAKGVTELLAAT